MFVSGYDDVSACVEHNASSSINLSDCSQLDPVHTCSSQTIAYQRSNYSAMQISYRAPRPGTQNRSFYHRLGERGMQTYETQRERFRPEITGEYIRQLQAMPRSEDELTKKQERQLKAAAKLLRTLQNFATTAAGLDVLRSVHPGFTIAMLMQTEFEFWLNPVFFTRCKTLEQFDRCAVVFRSWAEFLLAPNLHAGSKGYARSTYQNHWYSPLKTWVSTFFSHRILCFSL